MMTSQDSETARSNIFSRVASGAARSLGSVPGFSAAIVIVLLWAIVGPLFGFSDTWQLVINTGTTIVTFLMVFLIQNTQNRDSAAIQLKLDELIRATRGAHNTMINLEASSQKELDAMKSLYEQLARDESDEYGTPEIGSLREKRTPRS